LKETKISAGDAALYATPNDEAEFARRIATLMDDESLRARMGEVGRMRVRNELSWHVTSQNLLRAYEFLLGGAAEQPHRTTIA
jgi:glycosyltransferase involved in cell wall biosynthesis